MGYYSLTAITLSKFRSGLNVILSDFVTHSHNLRIKQCQEVGTEWRTDRLVQKMPAISKMHGQSRPIYLVHFNFDCCYKYEHFGVFALSEISMSLWSLKTLKLQSIIFYNRILKFLNWHMWIYYQPWFDINWAVRLERY